MVDPDWEGVFWTVSADGAPIEKRKHVCAPAFVIYGLCAFYRASGDPEALALAQRIWRAIERHGSDRGAPGYLESFTQDWRGAPNKLLGRLAAPKTFGTHFHLLEGYAALKDIWPEPAVKQRVEMLAGLMAERLLDHRHHTFWQSFEADWRKLDRGLSNGHDIEGAWLTIEVADTLAPDIAQPVRAAVAPIMGTVLERAVDADGGVATGLDINGRPVNDRIWWIQAEALVGFLDAFERERDVRFLGAAEGVWMFIQQFVIDRTGGEWRALVGPAGISQPDLPKVGRGNVPITMCVRAWGCWSDATGSALLCPNRSLKHGGKRHRSRCRRLMLMLVRTGPTLHELVVSATGSTPTARHGHSNRGVRPCRQSAGDAALQYNMFQSGIYVSDHAIPYASSSR